MQWTNLLLILGCLVFTVGMAWAILALFGVVEASPSSLLVIVVAGGLFIPYSVHTGNWIGVVVMSVFICLGLRWYFRFRDIDRRADEFKRRYREGQ